MKQHLTKLKTLLPLRNRLIYVSFSVVIVFLIIDNLFYIVLGIPYLYYVYHNHRDLLRFIVGILIIYMASRLVFDKLTIETDAQLEVKVIEVNEKDDYFQIIGRHGFILVNIYLTDGDDIEVGSKYYVTGVIEEPESSTIPSGFDYQKYLYSNRIKYSITAHQLEYISNGISVYQLREKVKTYIEENIPLSARYVKTFILADKTDIDQSVRDGINTMGISHMFAVSGYHIGLLVLALKKLLEMSSLKKHIIEYIIVTVLLIYMIITAFTPSVVRASLFYIFLLGNKKYTLGFSVLDILSFIFIGYVIINPYIYYNIGFVLSFYITFILIISHKILKERSVISTLLHVTLIANITSFTLVLNMNYQYNLLTIIFNIILIYAMSVVILPLTYIVFIFPFFDYGVNLLLKAFDGIIMVYSQIDVALLHGSFSHPMFIIIFNFLVMFSLYRYEKHKPLNYVPVLMLLTFIVATNLNTIDPYQRVVFLDIYGDSTFITDSFNKCTILIDTGEYDDYDSVIGYMKSRNIRQIDYVFLSHFHSDHYGEIDDILSSFHVKTVITNKNADKYSNQWINCGNLEFYVYDLPYQALNENNNSIVMSVVVGNDHYLFVGDSEVVREKEIMELQMKDVTYLKVGHHGSITSSSEAFLRAIKPQEAYVMVHRDNRHGHPSSVVMARYEELGIPIYRTDLVGTIELRYFRGKQRKLYYSP